jgi:hypothetical protein
MLIVVVPGAPHRFFLLYAHQPLAELVKARDPGQRAAGGARAIFSSEGIPGNTKITVPLSEEYAAWLGVPYKPPFPINTWLVGSKFGWKPPKEFRPTAILSEHLLLENAHVATGPLPPSLQAA